MNTDDVYIDCGNGVYYEEVYWGTGQLEWKGIVVNGAEFGYHEFYNRNGSVDKDYTGYYFNSDLISKDNVEGYCYICCKEEL